MRTAFMAFFITSLLIASSAKADVTICGEDPRAALSNLPPGEDLLLCPEVLHDFGNGQTRLGDMQGSVVRSSVPGTLAPVTGTFIFITTPTHNMTFSELHMVGSGSGHAFRFDAGSTNITIQDSVIENYSLASYVKSNSPGVRNIKIHRNIIRNNISQGVLGGCPEYEVVDNVFIDNGSNGIYDHDIYFGCGDPGDGSLCPQLISGNYITGSSRDSNGDCYASQIVTHKYINGLVIENNLIVEPEGRATGYCYGIDISQLPGGDYPMSNLTIRNNVIANIGRNGIFISGATGSLIENNIIYNHGERYTGSRVAIRIQPASTPAGDVDITKNIIDMSGKISSGGPIQIASGVSGPILITNNIQSYDDRSYFDLDDDESVGSGDIFVVLENLGQAGSTSDLNKDGAVGVDDLAIILRMVVALTYEDLYLN